MHHCPICESSFPEFQAVSAKKTRKAKCPTCGSVERHRFFWLLLKQGDFMPEGGRFLHFAPEPWLIKPLTERYGLGYLCVDYELPPYDLKVDIQNLPFRDGLFRSTMCFSVLEHIPDDHKAMRELARVLEPGGVAIIHVPLQYKQHASMRETLGKVGRRREYGQENHFRYYGLDIQDDLKRNGFASVEAIKPSDRFSKEEMDKYGLVESSRLMLAKKAAVA